MVDEPEQAGPDRMRVAAAQIENASATSTATPAGSST